MGRNVILKGYWQEGVECHSKIYVIQFSHFLQQNCRFLNRKGKINTIAACKREAQVKVSDVSWLFLFSVFNLFLLFCLQFLICGYASISLLLLYKSCRSGQHAYRGNVGMFRLGWRHGLLEEVNQLSSLSLALSVLCISTILQ